MASKEQIQSAINQLFEKYGKTLEMLSDSVDSLESKDQRIAELEKLVDDGKDIDIDLSIPAKIAELEKTVLNKND